MAIQPKTELNDDEKRWLLDDALTIMSIDQTLKKVGMTRREFTKYMNKHIEFKEEYNQALIDACMFIENDLLNIEDKLDNAKMAGVVSNNLMKVLAARNPEKYGNKLDLSVSQTVSIRYNLDQSQQRIGEVIRDVSPLIPPLNSNQNVG